MIEIILVILKILFGVFIVIIFIMLAGLFAAIIQPRKQKNNVNNK